MEQITFQNILLYILVHLFNPAKSANILINCLKAGTYTLSSLQTPVGLRALFSPHSNLTRSQAANERTASDNGVIPSLTGEEKGVTLLERNGTN